MEVQPESVLCRSESSLSISVNNPDQLLPVSLFPWREINSFLNFIFQEINRILSYTVTGKIFPDEAEFQETVELREGTETSFERYFEIYQR